MATTVRGHLRKSKYGLQRVKRHRRSTKFGTASVTKTTSGKGRRRTVLLTASGSGRNSHAVSHAFPQTRVNIPGYSGAAIRSGRVKTTSLRGPKQRRIAARVRRRDQITAQRLKSTQKRVVRQQASGVRADEVGVKDVIRLRLTGNKKPGNYVIDKIPEQPSWLKAGQLAVYAHREHGAGKPSFVVLDLERAKKIRSYR